MGSNNCPLPLSISLIASNEAKNLPRCLDAVCGIAQEIVIVHNDCTDQTVAIAQQYGATVYEHPWSGHCQQKNRSLAYCSQQWVLCLDCDEVPSTALLKEITDFIKHSQGFSGASFPRCSRFLGRWIRHGDWYPDRKVRLTKRDCAQWIGQEHEQLKVLGKIKPLREDLLHYTAENLNHTLKKIIAYSDRFVEKNPHRRPNAMTVIFRAQWRFFRSYFLRMGFLDGYPGYLLATTCAYEVLIKYSKLRCRQKN